MVVSYNEPLETFDLGEHTFDGMLAFFYAKEMVGIRPYVVRLLPHHKVFWLLAMRYLVNCPY